MLRRKKNNKFSFPILLKMKLTWNFAFRNAKRPSIKNCTRLSISPSWRIPRNRSKIPVKLKSHSISESGNGAVTRERRGDSANHQMKCEIYVCLNKSTSTQVHTQKDKSCKSYLLFLKQIFCTAHIHSQTREHSSVKISVNTFQHHNNSFLVRRWSDLSMEK